MNQLKTVLLLGILSAILVGIGGALGTNALGISIVLAVVMNVGAYFFSDRIVLAMHRAQELSPAESPELHRMVADLAARAGIPTPRLYLIPETQPNAFATGRNPEHAVVAVTSGILEVLDRRELRGVLAHELAHVKNRDILISTVVAVLAGAITLLAQIGQWGLFWGGQDEDNQNPLALIGVLAFVILGPIAALLIQLAVSRSREYEADHTGAEVSHDPLALASALRKLERATQVIPSQTAQPAFAHLYLVNPLSGRSFTNLFSTHPPLEERIRRLQAMAAQPGH